MDTILSIILKEICIDLQQKVSVDLYLHNHPKIHVEGHLLMLNGNEFIRDGYGYIYLVCNPTDDYIVGFRYELCAKYRFIAPNEPVSMFENGHESVSELKQEVIQIPPNRCFATNGYGINLVIYDIFD